MNRRIITLFLGLGVIAVVGVCSIRFTISAKSNKNIKLMDYTSPTITSQDGYQIDKYENVESKEWLSENEVLSLTKKDDSENQNKSQPIRYCSIYNLSTKELKDFKNVNINEFAGVSPDRKSTLYLEETGINKNVKMLNLATGEIVDVNTGKFDKDAEFKWVGNNKILINNLMNWKIIDLSGKVYSEGSYNIDEYNSAWIAGTDDIKDLGDSIEGKFYYYQHEIEENGQITGIKMCTMDVNTKQIKTTCRIRTICVGKNSLGGSKKGKTIIMYNLRDYNGKSADGEEGKVTSGINIVDEYGSIVYHIDSPGELRTTGVNCHFAISPDGNKAAYLESSSEGDILKVIDIKTGNVKEIIKDSSLRSENEGENDTDTVYSSKEDKLVDIKVSSNRFISNIHWSSTGTELFFTYGDSDMNDGKINTYIVNFVR